MDIRQGPHQVAQKSSRTGWPRKESSRTALPERSLSSKFGAGTISCCRLEEHDANNPIANPTKRRARPKGCLANEERIQPLLDLGLGVHAHKLVYDFAAFEEQKGRNGGDAETGSHLCIVIGV